MSFKNQEKRDARRAEAQLWYDSLKANDQSQIMEGYNKMCMLLPIHSTYQAFILRCHKIERAIEKGKHKKAFGTAEKAGSMLLKLKEKE